MCIVAVFEGAWGLKSHPPLTFEVGGLASVPMNHSSAFHLIPMVPWSQLKSQIVVFNQVEFYHVAVLPKIAWGLAKKCDFFIYAYMYQWRAVHECCGCCAFLKFQNVNSIFIPCHKNLMLEGERIIINSVIIVRPLQSCKT